MAWLILVGSGALEAVWAVALGKSEGFRRPVPVAVFLIAAALSMGGLAYSMTTIPTGTAYAVWVGVGASLTVLYSMLKREEAATPIRLALLLLLVGCVVGLKAVS